MSGIVGHVMYAVLAHKAARQRQLPIAPILGRHYAGFLCGAYLGCDIQTLPEAICVDTGQHVGYGTVPLEKSPVTGGAVRPWSLPFGDTEFRPRDIHTLFYGRAHLVFGWNKAEREHAVPWDHLADYVADVVGDTIELFGPGERQLAWVFGWAAHIVGDSLIKSVHDGIDLMLLDGKYTRRNRPIQDLVTFHEIGRKEFRLNWADLMSDLADTPVEPIQAHYMRLTKPRGRLAQDFPNAWAPQYEPLIMKVLAENHRYQKIRNTRLLKQYALTQTNSGWQCDPELSTRTGGLTYQEMVELAETSGFRHAMWQMGEAIADLYEQVVERQPLLQDLPVNDDPTWSDISRRWK
jgi:hypothetical protein